MFFIFILLINGNEIPPTAKRIGLDDWKLDKFENWKFEDDFQGGTRIYTWTKYSTFNFTITFTQFWIVGKIAPWHGSFTVEIGNKYKYEETQ